MRAAALSSVERRQRGGDTPPPHDRMTGCQWGFQSQQQLGLEWFLDALLVSVRNLGEKCFSTLDVVIKTSATRYNINDFGRYQRRS